MSVTHLLLGMQFNSSQGPPILMPDDPTVNPVAGSNYRGNKMSETQIEAPDEGEVFGEYQLHIKTWENDADNVGVKVISGLSKTDVGFYVEVVKQFTSCNSSPSGFGNSSITDDDLITIIQKSLEKHSDVSDLEQELFGGWDELDIDDTDKLTYAADILYDNLCVYMLGYPEDESFREQYHFCRVFDSYKVLHFPVNGNDVTSEF
jgi:hypothetical protein